jgi:serine/threonine protein phosphatase 1
MRRIAISDVHGCAKTFRELLRRIEFSKDDQLFLLGDYIDRGPDSRGVVDDILEMQEKGYALTCLRGNHEQMLLNGLADVQHLPLFNHNGGIETMRSFEVEDLRDLPTCYLRFFGNLPFYHEAPGYILVHAGLNFLQPDPLSEGQEMIWIRNWYEQISQEWLNGRKIVHGHTPVGIELIRQMALNLDKTSVQNIDAGCVYTQAPQMGTLCAFDLDSGELVFQANLD